MIFTTVTQQRNGATLRTGIAVQIDNMSVMQASEAGGASPYDSFWVYTTGGSLDVRRQDLLIDEQNVDPVTGNNTKYRVFGRPESFEQDHSEIMCEVVTGT